MIAPLLVITTYVCLLPVGAFAHALIPPDAVDNSDKVVPYLLAGCGVLLAGITLAIRSRALPSQA